MTATLVERTYALRALLLNAPAPATPAELARRFHRANTNTVAEILDAMARLGAIRKTADGRFMARSS